MSDPTPLPFALARRLTTYGRDFGVALGVGTLLAILAPLANAQVPDLHLGRWLAFLFGFVSTSSALGFILAGPKKFDAELRRLKQQKDEGVLSGTVYERFVERVANWYSLRRFGAPLPPAAEPPKTPRTRKPTPPPPEPPT